MIEDFGSIDFFKGDWSFTRIVTIGSTGQFYANAEGEASFNDDAGETQSLIYAEKGMMYLDSGTSHRFARSYRYRFLENGMTVYFNDGPDHGNLYQSYTLSEDGSRLELVFVHLCGPDQYRGEYYWKSRDAFGLRTIVTGAAKDLIIETKFLRKQSGRRDQKPDLT